MITFSTPVLARGQAGESLPGGESGARGHVCPGLHHQAGVWLHSPTVPRFNTKHVPEDFLSHWVILYYNEKYYFIYIIFLLGLVFRS